MGGILARPFTEHHVPLRATKRVESRFFLPASGRPKQAKLNAHGRMYKSEQSGLMRSDQSTLVLCVYWYWYSEIADSVYYFRNILDLCHDHVLLASGM